MKHHKLFKQYAVTLLLILPLLVFTSACSDDDDDPVTPTINEAELLVAELEGANGDYLNTSCPAIVKADAVYEDVTGTKTFHVIDIRAAADYDLGHVPTSVNVNSADIFTHMATINAADYDKIVIVCYTGQTAGWVVGLMRMSGITNVYSMKYGMSSWHSDFDKITPNKGSSASFVTTAAPAKPAAGSLPAISTGKSTGAEILADRVAAVHANGFGAVAITATEVLSAPDQYFIINYWSEGDYLGIGHIDGSYQYTPKVDLKLSAALMTLPTNKTIVVYCYTGQTRANVAAILSVLGYDAKTLKFGTQAMIWQTMIDAGKTAYNADNDHDCWGFDYEK